ncbi:MAG: 50S ribosomal protein L19 [Patescibacteria group bacterium]|nr:50S ribosomal protein L19 [Patescibacteria group bacterium]
MSNLLFFNNKKFHIGDTVSIHYKIKEGDKERIQIFKGILIKTRGNSPQTKTITVRKISKSGIGVERIFPLSSPFLADIVLIKRTSYKKAKTYFIRDLSEREIRKKLYRDKSKKVTE